MVEEGALDDAGSSPHTRGAPAQHRQQQNQYGIIPAYAGSTRVWACARVVCRDHPRIRGEHALIWLARSMMRGSSPHTRGAPSARHIRHAYSGIIPAYAGSTASSTGRGGWSWDHPRIRGEHRRVVVSEHDRLGSSPHTRGAPSFSVPRSAPAGIIPAYAGSTAPRLWVRGLRRDHPRIRGEHF